MDDSNRMVYGGVFIARFRYIEEKYGTDGLKSLIEEMKSMGYDGPSDPHNFKIGAKYPFEYLLILFRAIKIKYGENVLWVSSKAVAKKKGIVGFFIRWAGTPDTILKKASEYWPKFYTFGKLEGDVINEREAVIRGYDISPDPIFCEVLTHYFEGVLENLPLKNLNVEHTKCVHRGDEHCEWHFSWD